jgi:hypothetical protein
MVRKLGYIYLKPADGNLWRQLVAKSAETLSTYVIHPPDDIYCTGSSIGRSQRVWMQMIIYGNNILPVNNNWVDIACKC